MNFLWSRKSSTWDLDGEYTDNAVETDETIAHVGDADFRVETATSYDISSHASYKFRVERLLTGSTIPDTVYLAELVHEQDTNNGNYYLRERYGTADYDPQSGTGYSNEVWKIFRTIAFSNGPFTDIDITIHLITRNVSNGFYTVPIPGDYELRIRHYPGGVEAGVDTVGTATIRGLFVENLELRCPFDPLEGPGIVNFDVVAYPNDWAPTGPIFWKIWDDTGNADLLTEAPEPNGRVAQVSAEWSGTFEGEPLVGLIGLNTSITVEVIGPGNTYDYNNDRGVLHHRKCPCAPETGEVSFTIPIPIGGSSLSLQLIYQGFNACRGPSSFGYGWSSKGSALLTETPSGDLVYRDEGGRVKRWTENNGVYTPVRPDTYAQVESLGNPGAPYRVVFKDRSIREFNTEGKLSQETDRNGNTITYTYTVGGDLETISDGRGGVLTYDYGTRTDGQPISIRSGPISSPRLVQFAYDNDDRLISVTNPAGEVMEFEYNARGRLSQQTEVRPVEGDRVIEHTYDDPTGRKRYSDYYGLWRESFAALPWSFYGSDNDSETIISPIPTSGGGSADGRGVYYAWDHLGRIYTIERNRIGLIF